MPSIVGTEGFDSLVGGAEGDSISGLGGVDNISGGYGADTIDGGRGADTISGGPGADVIFVNDEDVVLIGRDESDLVAGGMDSVIGWSRDVRVSMGGLGAFGGDLQKATAATLEAALALAGARLGKISPETGSAVEYLAVEVGVDVYVFRYVNGAEPFTTALRIVGTRLHEVNSRNFIEAPKIFPNAVISGTAGPDQFRGGSPGNDTIQGLGGNDTLADSPGIDLILGGDGDDRIEEQTAGDTLRGGDGGDTLAVRVSGYRPTTSGGLAMEPGLNVPKVTVLDGGPGNDHITASTDDLTSVEADDMQGFDVVALGGEGADTIVVSGDVGGVIDGGPGDDVIGVGIFTELRTVAPTVTLGPGADQITYTLSPDSRPTLIVTDFQTGTGGDRINGLNQAPGVISDPFREGYARLTQQGPDTVLQMDYDGPNGARPFVDAIRFLNTTADAFISENVGGRIPVVFTPPASTRQSTAGADSLVATTDASRLSAGAGPDTIVGGSSVTYLRGDEGNDSIVGGTVFDDINGNAGNDTIVGGLGDDWVVGGKDDDRLFGDYGADLVYGNLGNDTLDGGRGEDIVRGGQGDDVLDGGTGDDFLAGDRGNDTITGGGGFDIFSGWQESGLDFITDFNPNQDVVRLDPGTTYTLRQDGSSLVIDMGGDNRMILAGSYLANMPAGWLFVA